MDTGSLLLLTALIILVVFIISRPFYSPDAARRMDAAGSESPSDSRLSELMGEKERLLTALRDIDSDHDLEKVPDDAYAQQRGLLLQAAARNLKAIDEMELAASERREDAPNPAETGDPLTHKEELDGIEEMIADRRRKRNEKSAGFCPHCGKVLQKSDHFCPSCGGRVKDASG